MTAINKNQFLDIFKEISTLGNQIAPFTDLAQSSSFIEGNKIAITQLVNNLIEKPWHDLSRSEKFKSLAGRAVEFVAYRFDYLVALGHASLDFVASLIKAIASSALRLISNDVTPVKYWRHTGVALFSILNSTLGVVTPTIANFGQLGCSAALVSIHGKNVKDQVSTIIEIVKEKLKLNTPPSLPLTPVPPTDEPEPSDINNID